MKRLAESGYDEVQLRRLGGHVVVDAALDVLSKVSAADVTKDAKQRFKKRSH